MRWIRPSTAYTDYTALISSATGAPLMNPTLAAGDVQISADGGGFVNLTALPTILPAATEQVRYVLSAVEVGVNIEICLRFKDQTVPPQWDTQFIWHRTDIASHYSPFPAGAIDFTYTLTDSVTLLPIQGADVWFSTDVAGLNIVWKGVTDAFGVARDVNNNLPWLDAGIYQVWSQRVGYAPSLFPDVEVAS